MKLKRPSKNNTITVYQSIKHRLTVSVEYSRTQLSDEVTHRIAARTVSGRDHETMTHVPRDTHVTKQRMAMRSNFPCSDLKKLGTPELSSSSSTSTALSLKNFEKRAHPNLHQYFSNDCSNNCFDFDMCFKMHLLVFFFIGCSKTVIVSKDCCFIQVLLKSLKIMHPASSVILTNMADN